MSQWRIGEVLVQKKLINWDQLEEALAEQKRTHEFVGEILVRKQFIPRFLLFKALAVRHGIPFADLSHIHIDSGAVDRIPKSVALKYSIMPIELRGNTLVIGVCDPVKGIPEAEIAALAKVGEVKAVLCTPEAVNTAIEANYKEQTFGAST